MFQLHAQKTQLSVETGEVLVSGAQQIYHCRFTFNQDWEELSPTIVFRTDDAKISVLPDPHGACTIPHSVLEVPLQELQVGVYGTKNGEMILPTVWASLGKILAGTTLGEDAAAPEPDIYDQILAAASRAEEIAQSVREDIDNGLLGGTPGAGSIQGEPARLISQKVDYQMSDSGTMCPSGTWTSNVPQVPQGKYLWTRTTLVFNTGDPVVSFSVARMGINGNGGSVATVNQIAPDAQGNVELTAEDLGALTSAGGSMTGPINMQGQALTGLQAPTAAEDAARKEEVDTAKQESIAYTNTFARPNLLDNWDFKNPINQRCVSGVISTTGYFLDRWKLESGTVQLTGEGLILNGTMVQILEKSVGWNVTASVLTSTGLMEGAYVQDTRTFSITASGKTILAAKLELGNTQTLAHQEGGGWVLNEIPSMGEQLARCQRFYEKSYDQNVAPGTPSVYGAENKIATDIYNFYNPYIALKVTKRTRPAVTVYSPSTGAANQIYDATGAGDRDILVSYIGDAGFSVQHSGNNLEAGHRYMLHWVASAEL